MGIDIDAKLIYGCNYSDLPEEILKEVNEMLDNDELDYASPYYDAPRDEWIVGVEVECYGHAPSEIYNQCKILEEEHDGFKFLNENPELPFMTLWSVPHVW